MKRLALWFASTATTLVLLFSYHTSLSGAPAARDVTAVAPVGVVTKSPSPTPVASVAPSAEDPAAAAPSPSPSPAASKATTTATTTATRTVNGSAASTRYGPVQVQITVQGGRITSARAIVYPTRDRRDQEINAYAIPQLNEEALQLQSADIDTVSGATSTSDGYRESLQSAIDAAHL